MDDYNVNVLSEAKNEYSSRLVTILTPLILEGIKSIFDEACKLCLDNDENEKYLMTFQNFLSRVPKWNTTIIEEETKRIIGLSHCNYLEDLITCVHITQLKILTSIRVSQKQKKIDIDIPKLTAFIHKCYIQYARKLYSNVYLFEKDILPLSYQKNMREAELLCQESILQVVRDGMPVEKILRAYIDETVDEEIIEETIEKTVNDAIQTTLDNNNNDNNKELENKSNIVKTEKTDTTDAENKDMNDVEKPILENVSDASLNELKTTASPAEHNINLVIETPIDTKDVKPINENVKEKEPVISHNIEKTEIKQDEISEAIGKLKFDDKDSVLDMGTNKSTIIDAPKTLERLEKISQERHEQRKAEEEEEEEDDDKLTIHSATPISLDKLDIHDLNKKLDIKPDPILDDIEVLT